MSLYAFTKTNIDSNKGIKKCFLIFYTLINSANFVGGGGKREVVGVHEEGGGMRREVDEKWVGGMFGGNINTWI